MAGIPSFSAHTQIQHTLCRIQEGSRSALASHGSSRASTPTYRLLEFLCVPLQLVQIVEWVGMRLARKCESGRHEQIADPGSIPGLVE